MKLVEKLLAYYKENKEDFANDIEQLDDWTGCLYDDKIYPMEDLNEIYQGTEPEEILRRAFYGYDEPVNKDEERLPFNPNREYFYFNRCGNLVSIDEKDYSSYIEESFIQDIIDNSHNLLLSDGSQHIIDDYLNDYEDE